MRRDNPRVPVDFYINKLINGVPYLARARDISLGGIYLHKLIEPRVTGEARISLEFALPGQKDVMWLDAEPVHFDGNDGVGFEFREVTPRISRLLSDYIGSQNPAGDANPSI